MSSPNDAQEQAEPTSSEEKVQTTENHQPEENDDDQDESEDFAVLVKVAVEKKEEGNKCYKNQEYREAIACYQEIVNIWGEYKMREGMIKVRSEDVTKLTETIVNAYNNAALCLIELDAVTNAFKCANSANAITENAKSCYIMGKCLLMYRQASRAVRFLEQALELAPDNQQAKALLEKAVELAAIEELTQPFGMFHRNQEREEEEMLQKVLELSKKEYEESELKKKQEEELKKKADEEQEKIRAHFLEEQQRREEEQRKQQEIEEEDDIEIDIDDDDDHHDDDEDEVSLTEEEIQEQLRLLELEEHGDENGEGPQE